jgi:glutamine---fructose-6-phosphate transaminase (isomerizing)
VKNSGNQQRESAMLREIYEQPKALLETTSRHIKEDVIFPGELHGIESSLQTFKKMIIAASGSSRHAGLAGEIMIEDLSGTAVDVEYASEYCYRSTHAGLDPLVVVISQSGETSDTNAAQHEALTRGAKTVAICNVDNSTMVREATTTLLTYAGAELAVPATKSFTSQLAVMHLLALFLARKRGRMTSEVIRVHLRRMQELPEQLEKFIPAWDNAAEDCARQYWQMPAFLYAGRGVHYAIAREGALKLKETSYAHAEGYPTGELSHGPQALVDDQLPVVALATCDPNDPDSVLRYRKSLPILRKIKQDGGKLLVIANEGNREELSFADHTICVPPAPELLLPIIEVVPLQLFAFHVATMNGHNVDKPRHLAKAVVE